MRIPSIEDRPLSRHTFITGDPPPKRTKIDILSLTTSKPDADRLERREALDRHSHHDWRPAATTSSTATVTMDASSYWQNNAVMREREDQKLWSDYNARSQALRTRLVELYDRRSQLQNELQGIGISIAYQEKEQERINREYHMNHTDLMRRRSEEDQRSAEYYRRAREAEMSSRESSVQPLPSIKAEMPAPGSAGFTSINSSAAGLKRRHPGAGRDDDDEPTPMDPGNLLSSVYHNPVDENERDGGAHRTKLAPIQSNSSATADYDEEYTTIRGKKGGERVLKPKQRHSLPTFQTVARSPGQSAQEVPPSTDGKTRSPASRKSLPSGKAAKEEAAEVNDGKEICAENLYILRDDKGTYTSPPMYAGVPSERIDKDHEYWDPEWQPLEEVIQPQLDKWREKLDQLRRTPDAVRHTVFLANRQVNRGQAVIDFLKEEKAFHPYQFVGKEMMSKFYKTFINYDTMFRLVNVHQELKKFDLDITPLDWLRQRMHEIAVAQGDKFSLSKTTHDLYHDAKLKALREKHGFGNIGRPSGYKLGERDPTRAKKGKKDGSAAGSTRKRGRRPSQADSDSMSVVSSAETPQLYQQPSPEAFEPLATPRMQKRQRVETLAAPTAPEEEEEDDLEYDGYTSTDSFSAGRIMHLDWRVLQVKTKDLTTSPEVTQYWTWKQDEDTFEHQVLRDVHPKVTWGYYQKPIDFNLKINDVLELHYASDNTKVHAIVKDETRGNVLVQFKRERTKRRFLTFAKKKQVTLVKVTSTQIETAWNNMKSETLADGESDH